jgi:hypothetical protein
MSFALTTAQIRNRSKTVTRRMGWTFLKPGDLVRAVVKAQGLKKGEHPEPLAILRIVRVNREKLSSLLFDRRYGAVELAREGFAPPAIYSKPDRFVRWFCETHGCAPDDVVTRIEFEYTAPP